MAEIENYPRLRQKKLIPAIPGIGWGFLMGTLVGVYKKDEGVVCYSSGENFCSKCPLLNDCPRPFGLKEPRHNNSIPAEKVKLSIV